MQVRWPIAAAVREGCIEAKQGVCGRMLRNRTSSWSSSLVDVAAGHKHRRCQDNVSGAHHRSKSPIAHSIHRCSMQATDTPHSVVSSTLICLLHKDYSLAGVDVHVHLAALRHAGGLAAVRNRTTDAMKFGAAHKWEDSTTCRCQGECQL